MPGFLCSTTPDPLLVPCTTTSFKREVEEAETGSRRLLVVARLDDGGERRDLLALAQPHHDHALRRAAHAADVVDRHADDRAAGRDQHHLVAVAHDAGAGEMAARLGELHRLHAHAAAALLRVLRHARALAVAVL